MGGLPGLDPEPLTGAARLASIVEGTVVAGARWAQMRRAGAFSGDRFGLLGSWSCLAMG